MRILVVGGGAREDALSWRLAQSPSCEALFHAPGNAGTATRGTNFSDVAATDTRAILDRARANTIDLVVVGPETALAAGVADRLARRRRARVRPQPFGRAARVEQELRQALHAAPQHPDRALRRRAFAGASAQGAR